MILQDRQEQYRKDRGKAIIVKWWHAVQYFFSHEDGSLIVIFQDNTEPYSFQVSAYGDFYHPKDCPTVSSIVGPDNCKNYVANDHDNGIWLITNRPQKIQENATLYMRSYGVTQCLNGPEDTYHKSRNPKAHP